MFFVVFVSVRVKCDVWVFFVWFVVSEWFDIVEYVYGLFFVGFFICVVVVFEVVFF